MTDLEEEHIPDFIDVDGNLIRREEVAASSEFHDLKAIRSTLIEQL